MASESWLEPVHLHEILRWIKVLKPVGFVEKWHFERGKLAARSQNHNRAKISFVFLNPCVTEVQIIPDDVQMHKEQALWAVRVFLGGRGYKLQLSIM